MRNTYRYRSFIWPALLILAGVVALLVNIGQIPVDRLYQALNLWPLVLVVIGLELIVRRTVHGTSGDIAAALIVLLAVVGAAAYVTIAPSSSATHTLDASAPVADIKTARLEIDAGAANVKISSGTDVGSDLYRAHIEYSGPKPEVKLDSANGTLMISQRGNNFLFFQTRRFAVNLQLNPGVNWAMELSTGATETTLDLGHLQVSSVSLSSGAAREEITLGPASGVVPVEINGGALTLRIHRPSGTEASVEVSGGAVSLNADGRNMHAVGHLSYDTPGLNGVADSYRIEVNGGACTVTLDAQVP